MYIHCLQSTRGNSMLPVQCVSAVKDKYINPWQSNKQDKIKCYYYRVDWFLFLLSDGGGNCSSRGCAKCDIVPNQRRRVSSGYLQENRTTGVNQGPLVSHCRWKVNLANLKCNDKISLSSQVKWLYRHGKHVFIAKASGIDNKQKRNKQSEINSNFTLSKVSK